MKLSCARELGEYKKSLKLSKIQKDLIIGSLLGDGNLRLMGRSKEASYVVDHSGKQKDYVFWKYDLISDWVNNKPRILYRVYHKDVKRLLISVRFQTFNHPEFTYWYKIFYQHDRKIIPSNIKDILISPLSLAIWFMDDGNKNHKAVFFNTQQFEKYEQERLIKCLRINFGLECSLNKHSISNGKQLYRIRVNTKSTHVFNELVGNYLLPSMRYKIPFIPVTTSLYYREITDAFARKAKITPL